MEKAFVGFEEDHCLWNPVDRGSWSVVLLLTIMLWIISHCSGCSTCSWGVVVVSEPVKKIKLVCTPPLNAFLILW